MTRSEDYVSADGDDATKQSDVDHAQLQIRKEETLGAEPTVQAVLRTVTHPHTSRTQKHIAPGSEVIQFPRIARARSWRVKREKERKRTENHTPTFIS